MTHPIEMLFVSWQDAESRRIVPIGRLLLANGKFEFAYIKAALDAAQMGFEPLMSFPKFDEVYRSDSLPPLFENRLMPRSREDFSAHLEQLDLSLQQSEPFTVLARTGGRRVTDRLEVFAPPMKRHDDGRVEGVFLARGIRHIPHAAEAVGKLSPQEKLFVMADVQNEATRLALVLRSKGAEIVGYIPDYLALELGRIHAPVEPLAVSVVKVNPDPAPVHHRLLCAFEYPAELGLELFLGDLYEPLSSAATRVSNQA